MRIGRNGLVVGLAVGLLLAGCGLPQSLPFSDRSQVRSYSDSQLDELVSAVSNAWKSLNTASGQVSFWEKKGNEISTSTAEFYWSRPEKLRANVLEASSAMKKGVKLVYLGDGKITAKLGFIKKTFPYDDPQVVSLRGYRIDQTSMSAIMNALTEPNAPLSYVGAAANADVVSRPGNSNLGPDLARVEITVDRRTHLPALVEGFAAEGVVFKATLTGVAVNPALPGNLFDL